MTKTIGIITARSGSKGIPDKNIKYCAGKPLIAWTIIEAKKAVVLDKVIVSTDSQKYADIAMYYGADVPFLRPPELATDTSSHYDVILHALKKVGLTTYSHCCILQPTSPLRNFFDINNSCIKSFKNDASVVSVTPNTDYPFLFNKDKKGVLKFPFFRFLKNRYLPRQKIKPKYHVNGALFVFPVKKFLMEKTIYCGKVMSIILPTERSIQIDTPFDMDIAELLLLAKQGEIVTQSANNTTLSFRKDIILP